MKNKQIIDSWNKIGPDSAADVRILGTLLAHNRSSKNEKGAVTTMNRTFNWKRLVPIAACLVFIVTVTVVIGNNANLSQSDVYTEALGENGTLNFYKSSGPVAADIDFGVDVISRNLTPDENIFLFGNLADTTSYAIFNSDDQSLLHVDAKTSDTTILLSAPGIPISDVVIDADRNVSIINGVPVSAGYFFTDRNSEGKRYIIYLASFTLDDISLYVELGGAEAESETMRKEIASVIETIIQNGTPDLSRVTA